MTTEGKPPRKRPKTAEKEAQAEATVIGLFGPDRVGEPPLDPDDIRPHNDYREMKAAEAAGEDYIRKPRKRIRTGRRWTELDNAIRRGEITMKDFVETLTPEELVRGQLKAEDGSWRGAPPKWVPSEFHQACMRELLARGDKIWRGAYIDAIEAFAAIARDSKMEPKDRLKAAQFVVERVAGKTPDRVEVAQVDPWETLISGIVAEAEDDAISRATSILSGEATPDTVAE